MNISGFFRDGIGDNSMLRLLAFLSSVTGAFLIVVSVFNRYLDTSTRAVGITTGAGLMGASLGAKVLQKNSEKE